MHPPSLRVSSRRRRGMPGCRSPGLFAGLRSPPAPLAKTPEPAMLETIAAARAEQWAVCSFMAVSCQTPGSKWSLAGCWIYLRAAKPTGGMVLHPIQVRFFPDPSASRLIVTLAGLDDDHALITRQADRSIHCKAAFSIRSGVAQRAAFLASHRRKSALISPAGCSSHRHSTVKNAALASSQCSCSQSVERDWRTSRDPR